MKGHRFSRADAALLVIDVQERLVAAMNPQRYARMLARTIAAISSARALGLPIAVTEQYSKGLGPTVKPVLDALGDVPRIEKLEFTAWQPKVRERILGRSQVLVVGMETHVCVFQTARDLADAGVTPFLAHDAVISRDEVDYRVGLGLCEHAGAVATTVEAAFFDALGRAGSPDFKAVSAAVK